MVPNICISLQVRMIQNGGGKVRQVQTISLHLNFRRNDFWKNNCYPKKGQESSWLKIPEATPNQSITPPKLLA